MINCCRFVIIFILFSISAFSQSSTGKWKSYLSYNQSSDIVIVDKKVYCATKGGLFYFNLKDNSLNRLGRENGLSDTEISVMRSSGINNSILIAYSSSVIDLISGNRISTFRDIERYQIPGNKSVYNISFINKHAYLSTGFGIIVFDLDAKEFRDTYDKIGPMGTTIKVNDITFLDNYIFALTDKGIYKASLNSPNLKDFNYWELITDIPGHNGIFTSATSRAGKVYVNRKGENKNPDIIYVFDGTYWVKFDKFSDEVCKKLISNGDTLIIIRKNHVDVFNENDILIRDNLFTGSPQYAVFDTDGVFWIADMENGLLKNPNASDLEQKIPDGPASADVTDIAIKNRNVIIVPGGATSDLNNRFRISEIFMYNYSKWTNWIRPGINDFYRIAIDPLDSDHFYIGSWGGGVFEFKNGELQINYNEGNSSLQSIIPGPYIRIGGMAFDKDNNLWIANSGVPKPVSVLTKTGEWTGFPISSYVNAPNIGRLIVTKNNHKWMILSGGRGLFVMDDKGTLNDFSDDEYRRLSIVDKNNVVISNDILALAEDRDGIIWLGSSKGVIVYYRPEGVFSDQNFYAQQIIIPRKDGSGKGDILLGSESVTAIAVDGANRKWLGTKNAGVFLVSSDGMELIHSFTSTNSPLLSNSIIAIAIDEKTGDVYFGTEKGVISFKGDAVSPETSFHDVYVYPNPVREDFHGDIIIYGLMGETIVKITDISGNLVYETKSLGGQALWNGTNFNGKRVKTGIYLVFCSDKEGKFSIVTKLLFIN